MKVDVKLSPSSVEAWSNVDKTVIVIDVLRASTTIITALQNGAKNVVPVLTPDEAASLKLRYDSSNVLLGGERGGVKIQGFDLGNSPLEYTEEVVKGKTIVFTTTNGTEAIRRAVGADNVLIGSYLNLDAVSDFVVELGKDVTIMCAGNQGSFALEDAACAGAFCLAISRLTKVEESDSAKASRMIASSFDTAIETFNAGEHGKALLGLGFSEDLEFCAQVNSARAIPEYHSGHLVLKK
ncbi:MAG: 2-phosphosulfolactate phosphatase [Firmicutes bacterium]|nr:2-phosphosulfolactate phosphatase [Bacillota bacterium]MDD4693808.1 2-phosphosulfolactate phosphatase [Bacillota bacterium]